MINSKPLVFRVGIEEAKGKLKENIYYKLIEECLGNHGDEVTQNGSGYGEFSIPTCFVDTKKSIISYCNYRAGGLEVYSRLYNSGELEKSQLIMCIQGNSKR